MGVSLTQRPTTPNAAYTRLPYVLSGSLTTSAPQYAYVMDVYESGSTDRIARVTQTPNPQGVAVFDPSRIFQGQLGIDEVWTVEGITTAVNANKTFSLFFADQFGTSPSSSVEVQPGLSATDINVSSIVIDPNNGISYNFQSGSYNNITPTFDSDIVLTNDPLKLWNDRQVLPNAGTFDVAKPIGSNDYETNSYFNNFEKKLNALTVQVYSGSVTLISEAYDIDLGSDLGVTYSGVGPKNLSNFTSSLQTIFEGDWTHYAVFNRYDPAAAFGTFFVNENLTEAEVQKLQYGGQNLETIIPPTCNKEKTRFAFINRFGVWDYYNNYNPVRRQSDIQRENVTLPQLDYSSISSTYGINNRGQKNYYTEVKDRFTVDTPLLDKNIANWLEELLDSPSVYVQKGDCFIPVIITNSQYQTNNETSRNKLFQYTIEFEPANQPYGDWDQIPAQCIESGSITPTPTPTPTSTPTPTPGGPTDTPTPTPTDTPTPTPVGPTDTPTPTPTDTPVPDTPTPTPTPTSTPTPTPSTYYARFITCNEPEGAIIQVFSSSPISTSIVLSEVPGECYEWFSTGGTGVDGNISTWTQFASCEACAVVETYWTLFNCETEVINQRTNLPTGSYSLSSGDRVTNTGGSVTYTIQGTTTDTLISPTTIVDTGLIGCPPVCSVTNLFVSTVSAEDAYCTQTVTKPIYHNDTNWADATVVYGTSSDCSTPQAGNRWYSNGASTWFWNGTTKTLIANPSCP